MIRGTGLQPSDWSARMVEVPVVRMPPMLGGQAASWVALIELSPILGQNWLLVGGQMVFLHELEREALNVRPTDDVDVVLDLRAEPGALRRIHDALRSAGFDQDRPSPEGTAHRYRRETALFDVLAPDNVGDRAQLHLGADARSKRRGQLKRCVAARLCRSISARQVGWFVAPVLLAHFSARPRR